MYVAPVLARRSDMAPLAPYPGLSQLRAHLVLSPPMAVRLYSVTCLDFIISGPALGLWHYVKWVSGVLESVGPS